MGSRRWNIPFIAYRRSFILLSLVGVALSLFLVGTRGLNYGIDFKGGIRLQYRFEGGMTEEQIRPLLDESVFGNYTIQRIGRPEEGRFALKFEQRSDLPESLSRKVQEAFAVKVPTTKMTLEREETVGPKAGRELRRNGQLALIASWVLILIYVGFRFDFFFAPGAIISLIHDVLISVGAIALTGREVSLTTIAALLTIIGYSINDTIVIYDRIRENLKKHVKMPIEELINLSVNEMFSRTLITNFTVFLVVLVLYLFGEGEVEGFGFVMLIGAFAGTYSTVFVASPVYIFLKKTMPRLEKWWKG